MNRLKSRVILIILLLFIFSGSKVNALMGPVRLYEKVEKSDLIAIGTVSEQETIFKEPTSIEIIAKTFTVEIKKVLSGDKNTKKVLIFMEWPPSDESALYMKGQTNLFFLRETKIDSNFIDKYGLPKAVYYEAVAGYQGLYDLADKKNREHVKTTEEVIKIKSIKSDKKRAKAWIKAVRSGDKILKENAIRELWHMKATEAIPTLKTVSKDDELYSLAQAAIGVIEMFPKKPVEPTKPINRMVILITSTAGILILVIIGVFIFIKRRKKTTV